MTLKQYYNYKQNLIYSFEGNQRKLVVLGKILKNIGTNTMN